MGFLNRKITIGYLFFLLGGLPQNSNAFPVGQYLDLENTDGVTVSSGVAGFAEHDFRGIIVLSNCSASIVRLPHSQDSDMALMLTNGHCLESGLIQPNEVIVHQSASRVVAVLNKSAQVIGRMRTTRIIYATMTKTDLAIYQLDKTYAQIRSLFKVEAYLLSNQIPAVGTAIQILSGYWRKGYDCRIENIAYSVKEGDWFFSDSIRYSRPGCDVIGGTSGSPILDSATKTVVGVNNSTNEDGLNCTIGNPCEIDAQGQVIFQKGFGYGQQTYWFVQCMNTDRELDLQLPTCALPSPTAL